jgi:hypothetical protein
MALDAAVLADAIRAALGYRAATDPEGSAPLSLRDYVDQVAADREPANFERDYPEQAAAARAEREASINALANAIAHGVADALVAHMAQAVVVFDADAEVLSPSDAVIGRVSIPAGRVT